MNSMIYLLGAGYLIGSIPWGKLICTWGGVDIQRRGSGNIGYANVLRIMGWKYAVPVLILDSIKGLAATVLGLILMHDTTAAFWVGYMAIIGHVFPLWLGFKGGKGIATGLGVMAVIAPVASFCAVITYALLLYRHRYASSVASVGGVAMLSILSVVLDPSLWWIACLLMITAAFTLRHNLRGTVPDYG